MKRLRDELGVAMATVLLVGATLTAVGTTASFVTIRELRQGTADRKAAEALAYAEAGVDRFLLELRSGLINYSEVFRAGCEAPALELSGSFGTNRSFTATLFVTDCSNRPFDDRVPPNPDPNGTLFSRIRSVGEHPTAKRVIDQDLEITALGLPIGVYAETIDANGSDVMTNVSVVSPGDFKGREKVGFVGDDPYYTLDDFYGTGSTAPIPAAAHVAGRITFVQGGGRPEHPPSPNCTANPKGAAGQSVWDGDNWTSNPDDAVLTSGCSHPAGFPPTSLFTSEDLKNVVPQPALDEDDYAALKQAAKSFGIYCSLPGTNTCTKLGSTWNMPANIQDADLAGVPKQFILYIDYTSGDPLVNEIKWKSDDFWPCSDDPALHHSVIIVIRGGGISMQSGTKITGAIIAPDGEVDSQGSYEFEGTVIAKKFWYRGGAEISLSDCWINNMPGPFLKAELIRWTEVDR
ncbi:MAG: hypothetical protein ACRDHO_11025 [Actinomycetota bacterium]